jgi:hypothetical protein
VSAPEQEHDRADKCGRQRDEQGGAPCPAAQQCFDFAHVAVGSAEGADHPGEREQGRNDIGRAGRTALERLQDLTTAGAVVIGGAPRLLGARGGRLGKQIVFRGLRGPPAAAGGVGRYVAGRSAGRRRCAFLRVPDT